MFVNQGEANTAICFQLRLNPNSQMRSPYTYKNLWWVLGTESEVLDKQDALGYGDLNDDDIQRILDWLSHPSQDGDRVFVGWNEHHGTDWKQTPVPMVRISYKDGVTHPNHDRYEARSNG